MARIERLPEDLVDKIAAGEVVERPASVVKELVENALDAGALNVHVDLQRGGRSLIAVRDDGCGMGVDDARRALERHATSKLRTLEDLHTITTHGFRGEALPSIASVSHLVLRTCEAAAAEGTEVEMRDGHLVHVRAVGHPRGTTVEVRDLFGSVPARRKFLRAESTETAHAAEVVTLLALARPEVGFFLSSGVRPLVQAPAVSDRASRMYQLFGDATDRLAVVEGGLDWVRVSGFVSRAESRLARPQARLFVNLRPVRDRALVRAVAEAYRSAGAGEFRGEAFLFIELPAHLVDANVHPAKVEVRFAEPRVVWNAVEHAVREALSVAAQRAPRVRATTLEQAVATMEPGGATVVAEGGMPADVEEAESAAWPAVAPGMTLPKAARALGQHRNTYIIASDGHDLLLVDQHTAHERVRFESLRERARRRAAESQRLLLPVVCALPPDLQAVMEQSADGLAELGYDVDSFGGGSVRLRAVPAVLPPGDPARALQAILRDMLERDGHSWSVNDARDRLAATLACHSAVRAGQALSAESMQAIVDDLARTAHPTLCPHGRPTIVRVPEEDVSRWFGRVGWKRR